MNRTFIVAQLRKRTVFASFREPFTYWSNPTGYHLRINDETGKLQKAYCIPGKDWSDWEDIDWRELKRIISSGYPR